MKPRLSVLTLGVKDLDRSLAFVDLQRGLRLALWPSRSLARDTGHAGATILKEAAATFYRGYAAYFQDPDDFLWEIVWNPASLPADGDGRS